MFSVFFIIVIVVVVFHAVSSVYTFLYTVFCFFVCRAYRTGNARVPASFVCVHAQNHEIHRRWVALVNDQNPGEVSIQGYLHLSIAIVGPGDRLKVLYCIARYT